MTLDPDGMTPMYVQLANVIAARISSGEYRRRIPSEETFRQEFGLARQTIRKAIALLRDRDLVVTSRRGTWIKGQE